ncbi:metal-dependent hydrolase [Fulvivirga sp. 29W222]|uniref:Metal-dependent hydrolase n=1 Tax=Fulvivirga marina TaxID=2494733 RepID=A0A937FU66_9BACT|nr:metal-dependent hydrolase [Fulvivirga marina]MBL6446024.1 metal-dependent hydrolase [Fulvivirga marina]
MASAFGHALVAASLGTSYPSKFTTAKFFILGAVCSILPDADVISFKLGIPYEAFWGHRGFTHSFVFALIVGVVITILFYRHSMRSPKALGYVFYFFLCTASHGILDALTSGGLGVAFFSPFDNSRYFFPWRPIKVSPIGIGNFFSKWGANVLLSETAWIGLPSAAFMLLTRKKLRPYKDQPKQ